MIEDYFDKMENQKIPNFIVYNKMLKRLSELTAKLRAYEEFSNIKIEKEIKNKIISIFIKIWKVLLALMEKEKNLKDLFLYNMTNLMKEFNHFNIWDKSFIEFVEFLLENSGNKYDNLDCLVYISKNEKGI
jgi:hypothetical protein